MLITRMSLQNTKYLTAVMNILSLCTLQSDRVMFGVTERVANYNGTSVILKKV